MLSLRNFHLLFILIAIIGADAFGVWAIRDYRVTSDAVVLALGIFTLVGAFGLVAYALWFVRKLDKAGIQ